jgi:glycoprotein-N-acetylgalactosamine 3-beta-galactosyltransferase
LISLLLVHSGDDQYVIIEHLRKYLLSPKIKSRNDRGEALYLGRRFNNFQEFNTGGAGYVLNRKGLELLMRGFRSTGRPCESHRTSMEDHMVAQCLRSLGIEAFDTRDDEGAERFHAFMPGVVLNYRGEFADAKDWFKSYTRRYNRKEGFSAISKDAVSFHYVLPYMQSEFERVLYHCKLANVTYDTAKRKGIRKRGNPNKLKGK